MGVYEPKVDLILLTLLVIFFGFEQRRRPEVYFRFWLVGWMLILLNVVCWNFPASNATILLIQRCLQKDVLLCGVLAFLFSFLVWKERWRSPLRGAIAIAVPMCLAADLIVVQAASKGVLYALILVGEGVSIWTAYRYLPRGQAWFFPVMATMCVTCGGCLAVVTHRGELDDFLAFMMVELFLAVALLYGRSSFKSGRLAGVAGFVAWGAFYAATTRMLENGAWTVPIYSLWSIPKYVVGVAMMRTIFGETEAEIAGLNMRHRGLYEEYRLLFMNNPHPMWIYDSATTRFLAANDSAASYGFSAEDFMKMSVRDIEVVERGGVAVPEGRQGMKRASRHRRADGSTLDVDVTEHDLVFDGHPARFMLAVDTTERELLHRELLRQARHDVLTGLPNRAMLDDRIEQCLSRCMREDKKGAVLTVDIDHFKRVNDTYGHLIGDECLKATAVRLSSRVRQVDTIARTGGEEFTIVIGGLGSREAAEKVCLEMLKLFDKPITCGEYALPVTVSIGVAVFPDDANDIEGLRRRSDQALYEAKRMGRNRVEFASTASV